NPFAAPYQPCAFKVAVTVGNSWPGSQPSGVGIRELTSRARMRCAGAFRTFTAIERTTKLMLAWHLGKRCLTDTHAFLRKLASATSGRFQPTTDGYRPYLSAVPGKFCYGVDFA